MKSVTQEETDLYFKQLIDEHIKPNATRRLKSARPARSQSSSRTRLPSLSNLLVRRLER